MCMFFNRSLSVEELHKQHENLVKLAAAASQELAKIKQNGGDRLFEEKITQIEKVFSKINDFLQTIKPPTALQKEEAPLSRLCNQLFQTPEESKKFEFLSTLGNAFERWGSPTVSKDEAQSWLDQMGMKH